MLFDLRSLYLATRQIEETPEEFLLNLKRKALLKGRDLRVLPSKNGFFNDEPMEMTLQATAHDKPYKFSKITVGYFGSIIAIWITPKGEKKSFRDSFFRREVAHDEMVEVSEKNPFRMNFCLDEADLPSSVDWRTEKVYFIVSYVVESMIEVCDPDQTILTDKASFEVYYNGPDRHLEPFRFPDYPDLAAHVKLSEPYYALGETVKLSVKLEGTTLPGSIHAKLVCFLLIGQDDIEKADENCLAGIQTLSNSEWRVDGTEATFELQIPDEGLQSLSLPVAQVTYGIAVCADGNWPEVLEMRLVEVHKRPTFIAKPSGLVAFDRVRVTPHQRNYHSGDTVSFTVTSVPTENCETLITSLLCRINGEVYMCHPISSTKPMESQDLTVKIDSKWPLSSRSQPICQWSLEADFLDDQGNVLHSASRDIEIHAKPNSPTCCSIQ